MKKNPLLYMAFITLLILSGFLSKGIASDGSVLITWDPVTTDLLGNPEELVYYYIYCNDSPYFEPLDNLLVGATSKTFYQYYDARLFNPEIELYFLVTAVDAFGNESTDFYDYTLPVELSAFNVIEDNGAVVINWTTQSETDILGFNIYKSVDNKKNLKKINPSIIKSAGQATGKTEYTYRDDSAAPLQVLYYKLETVEINGHTTQHEIKKIYVTSGKPDRYVITQNYPNPFNPHTTIDYALPEDSWVQIIIYNTRGERIKELVNVFQPSGLYAIQWDARNESGLRVSSGVYFYKIITKGFTEIKKMVLAK